MNGCVTPPQIGISAHIDSGKTTLSERILYYTGRIRSIHDVRGKDGVGAKMDSMELEREKGITIQSAATFAQWKDHHINVIDTPGHVDFTIEVERALRVLDGAVLVLCSVAGIQSQSMTVDRQMKRYGVPRLVFVNKLDRPGANPVKALDGLRKQLHLNAHLMQLPIGLGEDHVGVVDLLEQRAVYFEGEKGETLRYAEIPEDLQEEAELRRAELVDAISSVDPELEEMFLNEDTPSNEQLIAGIRRQTIALNFVPVFMGSAYRNKGVQLLLDAVVNFLPNPKDVKNFAIDPKAPGETEDEKRVETVCDPKAPLVALAFKLEESRFGQLTYMRVYSGTLRKGDLLKNNNNPRAKRIKCPRIVRMHADEMEDLNEVQAGDIAAIFGVDCNSGDTFTDGKVERTMMSMHVPKPVISMALRPKDKTDIDQFAKALGKFQREDPTFTVHTDPDTQETIISGMGELHLDIYNQRINREFGVPTIMGTPQVNYRETITKKATFDYLHKKQTGGAGQFARIMGWLEPLEEDAEEDFVYENQLIGNAVKPEYHTAIERGMKEAAEKGPLGGFPCVGVRAVVNDGQTHVVDSSEMAFKICARYAFNRTVKEAGGTLLEPIMEVEIVIPAEFQADIAANLNQRKAMISDVQHDGQTVTVHCEAPLSKMFGYSTDLRSMTQGKGEFSMSYVRHSPVPASEQAEIIEARAKQLEEEEM